MVVWRALPQLIISLYSDNADFCTGNQTYGKSGGFNAYSFKLCIILKGHRDSLQMAEKNKKDSRPDGFLISWIFFVLDAVQSSVKFEGWPVQRLSRLRWWREMQIELFG